MVRGKKTKRIAEQQDTTVDDLDVPTIVTQRPSSEFERPEAGVAQDPTRLAVSPGARTMLTRPEMYVKRKAVMDATGILTWLEKAGIPNDAKPARKLKKDGTDSESWLTASKVGEADLSKYRWRFAKTGFSGVEHGVEGITQKIENFIVSSYVDQGGLKIPDDWTDTEGKGPADWSSVDLLRQCLLVYMKHANAIVKREHKTSRTKPPYPFNLTKGPVPDTMPDLSKFSQNDLPDATSSIEWTMLKILGFPGTDDILSEMDVERHIGSNLVGIFSIPGTKRFSSTLLKYPTALGCFGSYPHPDAACQISADKLPGFNYCRPLILAAEAKLLKKSPDQVPPSGDNTNTDRGPSGLPKLAAQLAWAFQPTLLLFIADLVKKHRQDEKSWSPAWNPFEHAQIPEHMFLLGLGYDRNGVSIYAFLPRYEAKGGQVLWGFECREVDSRYQNHFCKPHSIVERAEILGRLLTVLDWGDRMVERLSGPNQLEFPPELMRLDKEWGPVAFW